MNTTNTTAPNRMPGVPAVLAALTGAARRSADAAHEAAKAWFATLQTLESALLASITLADGETVDATRLACAWDAWDAVRAHAPALSPYWDSYAEEARRTAMSQAGTAKLGSSHNMDVEDGIRAASRGYRDALARAGVPMPDGDIFEASYWRDAAARGC